MTKLTEKEYDAFITAFKLRCASDMKQHHDTCNIRVCRRRNRCSFSDQNQDPACLGFYTEQNRALYEQLLEFARYLLDRAHIPDFPTAADVEQIGCDPKNLDLFYYAWFLLFTASFGPQRLRWAYLAKSIRERISTSHAGAAINER